MLQSRRGFLIGAGAVLTSAFVKDARSFIHRTSQPLLASPSQVAQTLHWYELDEGYQLTLGPWTFAPPRQHGDNSLSARASRTKPTKRLRKSVPGTRLNHAISTSPFQRRYWEDWLESTGGPCAKAYHLLEKIDLGPERNSGAARSSSSTRGAIPAITRFMSTRRTCCRYCRRG